MQELAGKDNVAFLTEVTEFTRKRKEGKGTMTDEKERILDELENLNFLNFKSEIKQKEKMVQVPNVVD